MYGPTSAFLLPLLFASFYSFQSFAQVSFTSSNLPIVVINTNGQAILDDPKITADMGIIDNGPNVRNNVTDPYNNYNGKIGIEIRGSSSQMFPKKQYGIELRDDQGDDIKASLLGLPEEEDWVLFAPYNDKSLMRDVLAYKLGRDMGRYAPRTKYCEVVLNGTYQGVYILIEKIKRDKNRVDINKLNPDEISGDALTGGYILKIDKFTGDGGDGWTSHYNPPNRGENQTIFFQYEEPEPEDMVAEQKQYIQKYVQDFENVLTGENFDDPEEGYARYIDVASFIDYFIANEVTKNVDAYRLSTFFYKQRDSDEGKLFMGPIWDYNLGFGNADYCTNGNPEGFALSFNNVCPDDAWLIPFWWNRLFEDEHFHQQVIERWNTLRNGPFQTSKILSDVDSIATVLNEEAQQRNFQQWPVLGEYVWPNYYVGNSFQQEVDWLKNWITQRMTWLDAHIPNLITSVGEKHKSEETSLLVFPIPFNQSLYLQYSTEKPGNLQFEWYDLYGRRVPTEKQLYHIIQATSTRLR